MKQLVLGAVIGTALTGAVLTFWFERIAEGVTRDMHGDTFLAQSDTSVSPDLALVTDALAQVPKTAKASANKGNSNSRVNESALTESSHNGEGVSDDIPEHTETPQPVVVRSASPQPPQPTPWPQASTSPFPLETDIGPTLSPTPTPEQIPDETPTPEPAMPVRIVINEIAWMGTEKSSADEWIELLNIGDESVDLSGWTLSAVDGTPHIALSGTIGAGNYYVLERTDDSTISDIQANSIYTGGMANGGEILELRDASGSVIDTVGSGSWYNDNEEISRKQDIPSLERISAGDSGTNSSNWASNNGTVTVGTDAEVPVGNPIKGTPGYKNSVSP